MNTDVKCAPENCPLTAWAALSPSERKVQRKPLARKLHEQGFTPEQISQQFGVSLATTYRDLEFSHDEKIKPAKTASNPKGAGRPKGSTKKTGSTTSGRRRIKELTPEVERDVASAVLDEGKSLEAAVAEAGVGSVQQAKIAVAYERGRREAEPAITPDMLSMTAQQKLDAAIRQYRRQLDLQFHVAVGEKVRRHMEEIMLPDTKQKIAQAQELFTRRRALMDKETFNTIRRALHPDSRNSISDRKLAEAFDAFMALEKYLLDEKDSPTEFPHLPDTWEEWEAAKRATTAARRAKRGAVRVR